MISEFFADGMIPWSPILLSLKVAGLATAARLFPLFWTPCVHFR